MTTDTEQQPPALHESLASIAFLLGTWRGEGRGEYPTIEPFSYGEELRVGHSGRPFLTYRQRTWALGSGTPLHVEVGYVRPAGADRAELVVAQPSGVVEIDEGTVEGMRLTVTSTLVGVTSTAKPVARVTRTFTRHGRQLEYTLDMAAMGSASARHLHATLELELEG
ncbi:MAG: FABP family protein [Actinomycetota bacterium]|nr:FABP family protein [Actinomycetota bacterium]